MLALAFSFALFLVWTVTGRALVSLAAPRFGVLRSWLVAPAVGLAVMLLGLMVFNQLGIPINRFAWPLTAALLAAAAVVLFKSRPALPTRSLLPFAGAALFSLVWTGWPALVFGFKWISYGNDDMANYSLAAARFGAHGFFEVPTLAELSGRDYPSYFYFMHVADMMRFGAEHIVSWTAALGGLKPTQAFMPVILALALAQLLAAAALVLQFGRHRRRAVVAAWILAGSPMFMLGTLYQLIAQVGGIGLLLATLALMTRHWGAVSRKTLLRYAILPSVTGAALCIYYPEATPFAVLSWLAFIGLDVVRRRGKLPLLIAITAYTLAGVVILLRYNLISFLSVLVMQFTSAIHSANLLLSLFPYFLLPTGFSNLFGWMPIARDFPEPVISLSIVAGIVLAGTLLWRTAREAWQHSVAAILLVVQVVLAVQLYRGGNDFGLYKLAMFMQPAIAAALAGFVVHLGRTRKKNFVLYAVVGYLLSTAPTALSYTRTSLGTQSGGLTEMRLASRLGLHVPVPAEKDPQITATIENVVAGKFAASELVGTQVSFASRDYFYPYIRIDFKNPPTFVLLHPHYDDMAKARPLTFERNEKLVTNSMLWLTTFSQPVLPKGTDYYLGLTSKLSLFNKFGRPYEATPKQLFVLERASDVRNQLMFVHSGRGNHYYLGDRRRISFFQQETDFYLRDRDFSGIGRFMLLRVEQPSEEIYLRVSATRTVLPDRHLWSPNAVVHGEKDLPLGVVGGGAFNVFVGPFKPKSFEGAHYLAIDFRETPETILDRRSGLKSMYNTYVPLDYRRLIGWARDISAISPEQYRALKRPSRIARFPQDLAATEALEFSGAYDDGWLSPHARFVLGATPPGGFIRVRGFVPALEKSPLGTGVMRFNIGGRTVEMPASTGDFDWFIPAPLTPADRTPIDITFSVIDKLPGDDRRPTGGKLEVLELVSKLPSQNIDYGTAGSPRLASAAVDQDGWMGKRASVELPASQTPTRVTLELELPGLAAVTATTLRLQVGGKTVEHPFKIGVNPVSIDLPPSISPQTLSIEIPQEFALPAPDTRRRAGRLLSLKLAPSA